MSMDGESPRSSGTASSAYASPAPCHLVHQTRFWPHVRQRGTSRSGTSQGTSPDGHPFLHGGPGTTAPTATGPADGTARSRAKIDISAKGHKVGRTAPLFFLGWAWAVRCRTSGGSTTKLTGLREVSRARDPPGRSDDARWTGPRHDRDDGKGSNSSAGKTTASE